MKRDLAARPAPLLALLHASEQAIAAQLHHHLRDAGFDDQRPAHDAVFAHLPPEGLRLTELAERARVTKQAMGELVDDLERKGYLHRRPDPTDRRAKLIEFAPRGWDALGAAVRAFDDIEAELTREFGSDPLTQLRQVLQRIAAIPA